METEGIATVKLTETEIANANLRQFHVFDGQ